MEAKISDILEISTANDDNADQLPSIVRDLIIHDRGNLLFLGDSFANLPSPVNESQNLKKLFKYNDEMDQNRRRLRNDKENNIDIKIEGKDS